MYKPDEIAIIGIGCVLPAGLKDGEAFWRFLLNRQDGCVDVPADRWGRRRFYDPVERTPGKTTMQYGHFMNVEDCRFEPLFFGISPREGLLMETQQRLLLNVSWHAMENAGVTAGVLMNTRTGVFIGSFTQDQLVQCGSPFMQSQIRDQFAAVATGMTMYAARIAHVFGLRGPAIAMDTACSSSLVAVHQACNSLRLGECDIALAGGVNYIFSPQTAMLMTKGHFLAKDGRSKSFAADADGYGRGEGCVIFMLKRLKDAMRDGDDIRGVICNSGVNQDGRTPVLTMPDAGAQETLIRDVLRRANVNPQDVAYVEAHGTGTPVGDPIEVKAIAQAIGQYQPEGQKVLIGSVKANLGHMEAAAGGVAVLKAMLCLEHGQVPGQANLKDLNPAIPFDEYRVQVAQGEATALPERDRLYAVVNSFGYGGTNAVALLRRPTEAERNSAQRKAVRRHKVKGVRPAGFMKRVPLLLSAFSEASLGHMAGAYARLLDDGQAERSVWEALCFSAVQYRTRFRQRAVILPEQGEDEVAQAHAALHALAEGKTHSALFTGKAVVDETVKPVFLFSGMGPQWWGMGRYLLRKGPTEVRALAQRCDALFMKLAGWSLREELLKPEAKSRMQETEVAQPAIFLVQICLAAFFTRHGVMPGAIIGHSVGEVAAAYVSGALELEDAVTVIFHRSRLQATRAGTGTMLAVGMSRNVLEGRLEAFDGQLSIAAINSSESCTVAGPRDALEMLEADCTREGVFARFLKVDVPYHSPEMTAIEADMLSSLAGITPKAPTVPLYSTVTGKLWEENGQHDAAYWYANAREPVLFHDAMRAMLKDGHAVFLELAVHPVLGTSVTGCAVEERYEVAVIPTLRRRQDDAEGLLRALIRLTLSGGEPDWRYVLYPKRRALPFYCWEVEKGALLETEASRRDRLDEQVHPVLGTPSLLESRAWRADIGVSSMEWLMDHKVHGMALFPAAAYIEAALATHAQLEAKAPAVIEEITINTPLVVQEGQVPVVMWRFDTTTRRLVFDSETVAWNGDWQTHGQATVLQAAPWCAASEKNRNFDFAALCEGTTRFDGAEVYQAFAAMGLDYGPAFQTLRSLHRGDGYSVAEVALGEKQAASLEDYHLHPALLDGAMHALIGAFPFEEQKDVYVPASIERISYLGQKVSRAYVKAMPTLRTHRKIVADLRLYTPEGELLCEILGLCCRRVARSGNDASSAARLVYAPNWVSAERQVLLSEPLAITLLGEGDGLAAQVAEMLKDNGAELTASAQLSGAELADTLDQEPFLNRQRALVLFPRGGADYQTCLDDMAACVELLQRVPMRGRKRRLPVIIVTRGAYDTAGQAQALQRAYHGLFRGAEAERMDLAIRCVDVPDEGVEELLEDLAAELVLEDPSEDTVWLRLVNGPSPAEKKAVKSTKADAEKGEEGEAPAGETVERLVQRLVSPPLEPEPQPVPLEEIMGGKDDGTIGVRLESSRSGALEGVTWQAFTVPKPGPGEVKIRTRMASLNFKDVLKAMSLLPESVTEGTFSGDDLGLEGVVEVESVGEGVDNIKPGDLFALVYPDSFSYRRIVGVKELAYCALPLSEEMLQFPLEQIAGVPLVFVTSYYTLVHLAQIQEGESVLIHAGAGGVGQAAIQIAKLRKAVIYSTAGNPEKREYLRQQGCAGVWDSRTLEFVDGIREATNGRGVDVVLNSLPGEAMVHSLKLVAPMGRFVEIGKRDIVEHRVLDLMPFNENLAYFSFDMDRMVPREKLYGIMSGILGDVMSLARQKKLSFPQTRVFRAAEVTQAFRYLTSSRHIGKVVISYEGMGDLKARPLPRVLPGFSREGAYLVTGGMGGFGLKTAEYLLSQGAGVLHLVGRSLPKDPERQEAIVTLKKLAESAGGRVVTHRLDVTDKEAVKQLVQQLARDEVPLRGVFHAAGVVDDQLISKMDAANVAHVMAPKVLGAQALDEATQGLELDHFVLYSSFTAEIGNLGQSSYIAANSYLNALAENRQQQGLSALAVGWGAIGDAGMLMKNDAASRMFDVAGIKTVSAVAALRFLPIVYAMNRSSVSLVDVNWSQIFTTLVWTKASARFSLLQQENCKGGVSDSIQLLMNMPSNERLDYVLRRLKQQLGAVLQFDSELIEDSIRLSELGIDSLAAMELQTAIRSEFGVNISLVLLARNETIIEVARSLLNQAIIME
ncbi:SDR family NAD(P)-dependent oxidoreductase [Bombella sp. TMW 2.2559]|uniref:SDR family NAD(P)-dependent oxidoreductase n=1 Tax=Bombella dulcis TaxID=2967339 RepID=A0ABT3WE59_9PROT|nr:type I polyketide synthase [Bombella dulcis]MCX5616530.1 SDR family NAD(P)-dependent oxidoreductase [Bombella dulcis]